MNRRVLIAGVLFLGISLTPLGTHVAADEQVLFGYSAESSRAERQWEEKFREIASPQNLRAYMQQLSARPHHVGSEYDRKNAEWIAAKFKEFGLDAHIEQFDVLYPTPKERAVELVDGGPNFAAKLQEPPVPQDPTSNQQSEQLPTYHAYSKDGDVTAPLVYVNYGIPEDYEQLERLGVSVNGAIVIARYFHSWRGIKPKVAAEHGAIGCLIYSDPHEDGYFEGDSFPTGAWRPKDGAQRGSVADMPLYPGDPLTPGIGATKDAKRLKVEEAPTLTKIPVLPISYADAQPLLAALGGRVAPEGWRGALAITYHLGPGPAKVHLKVKSNWEPLKPVYDVIAKIPGSTFPDEWVIRGNHHDAWVNGAEDPTSGMVAVLEEARALGQLLKSGWKPKRTIILCAWDGEEPGLLGSTEWAEAHYDELRAHGVAYINSDSNGRGYLGIEGSHTLEKFSNDIAHDIMQLEDLDLSEHERTLLADGSIAQKGRRMIAYIFDQARKASPCVLLLDDIDAFDQLNTDEERQQWLQQLLVEMDGRDYHPSMVVIAATQHPDGLDLALLHPARFEQRVVLEDSAFAQTRPCPSCKRTTQPGWKHCMYCGTFLVKVCPHCNVILPDIDGVQFCFECGSPLK